MFNINRIPEIKENPERFRLLERIPYSANDSFPIHIHDTVGDEITLALIDFETTGFTAGINEVIELGMVQVAYSPSIRKITAIKEILSQFEQPITEISQEITAITGITNEMVAGQSIDDAHVARLVNESVILIAHNASFDRSFWDIRFKGMADRVWACSVKDIDWYAIGFESAKLEYLLLKNGYFYDGHRAATDCLAMVQLFEAVPNSLHEAIQAAKQVSVKILAKGVAYADREIVKKRGYRWDADSKYWWFIVTDENYDEEKLFLDKLCGSGKHKNEFVVIKPCERYSSNV